MALTTKVGSFLSGTGAVGADVAVTGVGFKPQLVLFACSANATTSDADAGSAASYGQLFGAMDDSGRRWCATTVDHHNVANANCFNYFYSDAVVVWLRTDSPYIRGILDYKSMDNDGFTLVVDSQYSANRVITYIAIGGIKGAECGTFTFPTSSSLKTVDLGIRPTAVFFSSTLATTAATKTDNLQLLIGGGSGENNEAAISIYGDHGAASSTTDKWQTNDYILVGTEIDSTSINDAFALSLDGGSLGPGKKMIIKPTPQGPQSIVGYAALSGAQISAYEYSSSTGTGNDTITGIPFAPKGAVVLHASIPSVSNAEGGNVHAAMGIGFVDSARNMRSCFSRTPDGNATIVCDCCYRKDCIICGSRTPSGSYSLRFRAEIDSWTSDGCVIDMLENDDSYAMRAYILFLGDVTVPMAASNQIIFA